MLSRQRTSGLLCVALCLGWLAAGPADACDTPVFRYALERWQASYYGVLVFHDKELTVEQQKVVDWLGERAEDPNLPCNVAVQTVDVSGDANVPERFEPVFKAQEGKSLPRMVLCYPLRYGPIVPAWSTDVTMDNAIAIADSPVRRKIVEGILSGDSAVWVLLESGDKEKDDAAAKMLTDQFAALLKELELPPQPDEDDPYGPPIEEGPPGMPKLKLAFSLLRFSRTDPAERAFVQMLLSTEEDLSTKYASEPMAFAVFGQGRAMWALVGEGISEDNVFETCAFLVGRCSCQVKDLNPGVDIVFAANWYGGLANASVGLTAPPLPAPIAAVLPDADANGSTAVSATPAGASDGSADTLASVDEGGNSLFRNTAIAVGIVVLAAAALAVWVSRRPAKG